MPGHVFIHVETLGTRPGCALLGIAAVALDPQVEPPLGASFDARIDLADSEREGFGIEACAVGFWMEASLATRRAAFSGRHTVRDALASLLGFLTQQRARNDGLCVWTHWLPRDIGILEAAYRRLGMGLPWPYPDLRDAQTLFACAGIDPGRFFPPAGSDLSGLLPDAQAKAAAVAAALRRLDAVVAA